MTPRGGEDDDASSSDGAESYGEEEEDLTFFSFHDGFGAAFDGGHIRSASPPQTTRLVQPVDDWGHFHDFEDRPTEIPLDDSHF